MANFWRPMALVRTRVWHDGADRRDWRCSHMWPSIHVAYLCCSHCTVTTEKKADFKRRVDSGKCVTGIKRVLSAYASTGSRRIDTLTLEVTRRFQISGSIAKSTVSSRLFFYQSPGTREWTNSLQSRGWQRGSLGLYIKKYGSWLFFMYWKRSLELSYSYCDTMELTILRL